MGFAKFGWRDPIADERALQAVYVSELESLGERQMAELTRVLGRHEQERAAVVARCGLARERFWREWAGLDEIAGDHGSDEGEQRRVPS
jgi:hypothetical protein